MASNDNYIMKCLNILDPIQAKTFLETHPRIDIGTKI